MPNTSHNLHKFTTAIFIASSLVFFANFSQGSLLAQSLNPLLEKSISSETATVSRVLTTDTVILSNDKKVKLIGLSALATPKRPTPKRDSYGIIIEEDANPAISLEERALEFVQSLLKGKKVRLEFDILPYDEDFYTLAYVFLDDNTLANVEILRQGFADLKISPPNTKYADLLRSAYQEARKEQKGIHGQ